MPKKFQRKIEDFVCVKCGRKVIGNGYTDHCPKCLRSIHIDINPGDREARCGGLMKPTEIEIKNSGYIIRYLCQKCGYKYKVRAAPDDDFNEILKISGNIS